MLFSAVLGWWGFPFGLILTPVQMTRNIIGMCRGSGTGQPSPDLRRLVLANLGLQALRKQQQAQEQAVQPPPPPPAAR
jgi:hypothetical protein